MAKRTPGRPRRTEEASTERRWYRISPSEEAAYKRAGISPTEIVRVFAAVLMGAKFADVQCDVEVSDEAA